MRYPFVYFEVVGVDGGFVPKTYLMCGLINKLRSKDFVAVEGGAALDPFAGLDGAGHLHVMNPSIGTFREPGQYTVTFRYTTDEPLLARWNLPDHDDPAYRTILDLLRQVPLLDLSCSTTLSVDK
jgi:hypothetical protein